MEGSRASRAQTLSFFSLDGVRDFRLFGQSLEVDFSRNDLVGLCWVGGSNIYQSTTPPETRQYNLIADMHRTPHRSLEQNTHNTT